MNFSRFEDLTKEEKEKITLNDLTVSEIKNVIEETVFSKEIDVDIAILRFAKNMTHEKIAERIDYHKNTIQNRLIDIEKRLNKTIQKLLF